MKTIMKMNIERLFLASLLLISVDRSSAAGFVIDWSVTIDGADFGLPGFISGNQYLYTNEDNNRVVMKVDWRSPDSSESPSSIIVTDSQGEILAKKAFPQIRGGTPFWCDGDTMLFQLNSALTAVWKFQPDASVTEEPFPFGGQLFGGNLKEVQSGTSNESSVPLFSVQEHFPATAG